MESLKTRGPRSISILMEDTLRVQVAEKPRALIFSDSRQDASQLAVDLRRDHRNDMFRQLIYHIFTRCRTCTGSGVVSEGIYVIGQPLERIVNSCEACAGTGRALSLNPMTYADLRREVIDLAISRGIDPSHGQVQRAFELIARDDDNTLRETNITYDVMANREITQQDFGLEPLGLAVWSVNLPPYEGRF